MYGHYLECLSVINMKKTGSQNLQILVNFIAVQLYVHLDVQFMSQNFLRDLDLQVLCLINEN